MQRRIDSLGLILAVAMTGFVQAAPEVQHNTIGLEPQVWKGVTGRPSISPFLKCALDLKSWTMAGSAPDHYEVTLLPKLFHESPPTCGIAWRVRSTPDARDSDFGVQVQSFPAEEFRGKRMRFSALVRALDATGGAGLVGRVDDANRNVLAFDDMQTRPIIGTVAAKRYEVVLDVPKSSEVVLVGFVLVGKGSLWVSDVRVDTVGADVPVTDILNLTPPPAGSGVGKVEGHER